MVAERLPLRFSMGLSLAVSVLRLVTLPVPTGQGISVEVTGNAQQISDTKSTRSAIKPFPSWEVEVTSSSVVRRESAGPATSSRDSSPSATDRAEIGHGIDGAETVLDKRLKERADRAMKCRVPGHLALPMELSETGSGTGIYTCTEVFEKARDILDDYIGLRNSSNPEDVELKDGGWVAGLKDKIENMEFSEETMDKFDDVLSGEDLGEGLMDGKVWTASHATVWDCCNKKISCVNEDGNDPLEAAKMPDGATLNQGDEAAGLDGTGFMLLEATMMHRRSVAVDSLWPATGTMTGSTLPLTEIAICYASSISDEARLGTEKAKVHIEEQIPCVKFKTVSAAKGVNKFSNTIQENCAEFPSIIVQSHIAGCWSPVGMISGRSQFATSSQPINIGTGCGDMGIVAHEIGHAIGMLHEMSRSDRDAWVAIQKDNVPTAQQHNFEMNVMTDNSSAFDFLSLMMYGSYEFSKNGDLTVKPKDVRLVNFMGQRMGFSELDVELIGDLYKCKDKVNAKTKNKHMSQAYLTGNIDTGFTGFCKDAVETGYQKPSDGTCCASCTELKTFCSHDTQGEEVRKTCPVSCFMCEPCLGDDCPEAPLTGDNEGKDSTKAKAGAKSVHGRPSNVLLGIFTLVLPVVLAHGLALMD